jgi:DNA-directed RNA polymerase subunit RPC12/RpoP/very-short-patch-repair endonuclease
MSLSELKKQYEDEKITLMEFTHRVKKFKEELDLIYPQNISLSGKAYLYLHDYNSEVGWCSISNKEKRFISMSKGYRKFCGNMDSCQCNLLAKNEFWKNADIEKINSKRKETVKSKYGVDVISKLPEIKVKAANTCFKKYGVKSPTQNPEILKKSSMTCLKNNGVEWPQQNKNIYEKTKNTFLNKYGVERPSKHPIFKEAIKNTCIKRYGVVNVMKNENYRDKVKISKKFNSFEELSKFRKTITPLFTAKEYATCNSDDLLKWKCLKCNTEFYEIVRYARDNACPTCNPKNFTWGEILIKEWLDNLNINYVFGSYDIIPPYQIDFYIPDFNLAIEFNGLYWHSELAGRDKNYHFDKFKMCKEKGIRLIQIFEHELMYKEDIVKQRIINALKLQTNKMGARSLKLIKIDSKTAKKFFDENHLQGGIFTKYNYGLIDKEGKLYSAMGLSKSRFSKKEAEYELVRFASLKEYSISGAATKLFHAFIKELSPASVISYANLNWGIGNVYENMGFKFSHYSSPNYWYFKSPEEVYSRVKFQKHKLPKELHHLGSEWDIMKHLKWNRFWDSGNAVYVYKS